MLRLPSEIVADRFVPTARAMLAAELDARGLSQQAIASHLGVSQPAVSNYVGGDVALEPRFSEDPRMVATIEAIAGGFATGEMDGYEALSELVGLVEEFEDRGPICAVHEEAMPALEGLGCDICVRGPDEAKVAERNVLESVRRAARLFASSEGTIEFVPNVGSNIGEALPDAHEATDVAAVPGRLHAIRGRVEMAADPEFGASEHVSSTVLAANAADPEIRGAINVATDDRLLDAARERGIEPMEFDADYKDREERLRESFADRDVPRVLYHRGAFAIEPITYVLGASATDAVELATDLAEAARAEH
jgi:predicted fused transcriptional regulator/phosphomethylpyrimidine kinase/predicted transcriptional regulator